MKVIAIGIDGLDYIPFTSYLYHRKSRGLKDIYEERVLLSRVFSTDPPMSPPAWSSILTGLTPIKHGIFDFYIFDKRFNKYKLISSNILPYTIFDVLSWMNIKQILINIPILYPPRQVNGVLVSGLPSPYSTPTTFPVELARRIEKKGLVVGEPPWSLKKDILMKTVRDRSNLTLELIMEYNWDFLMTVFRETDIIQHYYWGEYDILQIYELIDKEFITPLIEILSDEHQDYIILIFGDHGFTRGIGTFYISNWLRKLKLVNKFTTISDIVRNIVNKVVDKMCLNEKTLLFLPIFQNIYLSGDNYLLNYKNVGLLNANMGVIDQGGYLYLRSNAVQLKYKIYKLLLYHIRNENCISNIELVDYYKHSYPDFILSLNKGVISSPLDTDSNVIYIERVPPARRGVHKKDTLLLISSSLLHNKNSIHNLNLNIWDLAALIIACNGIYPINGMDGHIPQSLTKLITHKFGIKMKSLSKRLSYLLRSRIKFKM